MIIWVLYFIIRGQRYYFTIYEEDAGGIKLKQVKAIGTFIFS